MQMAEKVSETIFSRFGWAMSGPTNQNFPCEKIEDHQKESSPTHPVDAVFHYDDPYEARRRYFLTDLKSYSIGSLNPTRLKGALRDLAKAVDCANVSADWRQRWVNGESDWSVHGLLFIFNHDAKYDGAFTSFFRDEAAKKLDLPRLSKLYVFGPDKIAYFMTLLNDLKGLTADRKFPFFKEVPFFYPDRIRRFAKNSTSPLARIELLMGPWQIIPYDFEPQGDDRVRMPNRAGYYIYYQRTGKKTAEFEFLFDFCFRNQMVKDGLTIDVRMPFGAEEAIHNFAVAKENFAQNFYSSPDIKARLGQFTISPVQSIVTNFSTEHVGMERRANG